mmetsp:Transcript_20946/g.31578  ORF Transcript_20946/g.31578 Transcript_20946/m.31578 type:complete len:778 (-) Transcript_20946:330-2663(-)
MNESSVAANDGSTVSSTSSGAPKPKLILKEHTLLNEVNRNSQSVELTNHHSPNSHGSQLKKRKKELHPRVSRKRNKIAEKTSPAFAFEGPSFSSTSSTSEFEFKIEKGSSIDSINSTEVNSYESEKELPSPQRQKTNVGLNADKDEGWENTRLQSIAWYLSSQTTRKRSLSFTGKKIVEDNNFEPEKGLPNDKACKDGRQKIKINDERSNANAREDIGNPQRKSSRHMSLMQYPQGWRSPSELRAIAGKYRGLAIQYRVCYAEKEVKDNFTKKVIPKNTLIVQSRFVSEAGNRGGQSFSFLTWHMPGCNKRSKSIYNKTRPQLWDNAVQEQEKDAYPFVVVDESMHEVVKILVKTFLNEALVGASPLDFYGDGKFNELFFLSHRPKKPAQRMAQAVNSLANDNFSAVECAKNSIRSDGKNPTLLNYSDMESCLSSETFPKFDDVSITAKYPNSTRGSGGFKRKHKRIYGKGEKWRRDSSPFTYFDVPTTTLSEATQARSLVLVEGISKVEDVFLDQRVDNLPTRGRLLELTSSFALAGRWRAKLETNVSGFLRDLEEHQVMLRHERYFKLGSLSDIVTNASKSVEEGLHVSKVDPSHNRACDFIRQGIIAPENIQFSKIGSISLAVCEGCTSSSDANSASAGKLAAKLLRAAKGNVRSEKGFCSVNDLENLIAIPDPDMIRTEAYDSATRTDKTVGVSLTYHCNVQESYQVLIGQDEQNDVVAVDSEFQSKALTSFFFVVLTLCVTQYCYVTQARRAIRFQAHLIIQMAHISSRLKM